MADEFIQTLSSPTFRQVYAGLPGPPGDPGETGDAGAWGSIVGTLGDQTDLAAALAAKAPLASPTLTGVPAGPTAAPGTNTTQLSTTAFVAAAIAALVGTAPGVLDTLGELSDAINDDANLYTTLVAALALKAPLASPALTGAPTAPTASPGTNTTQIASTAFVEAAVAAGGGGGGGSWQLQWGPLVNEPPTANYATLDTRNSRPVLDFDTATSESAIFTGVLPADYAGGGVTVHIYCALTSATSGTVGWLVAIERTDASSLDIDADSFASNQTVTAVTVPGTSGQVLKMSVNISNGANMDSLAAGELFRIKVARDTANDTATGDAELLRVMMVEQ